MTIRPSRRRNVVEDNGKIDGHLKKTTCVILCKDNDNQCNSKVLETTNEVLDKPHRRSM